MGLFAEPSDAKLLRRAAAGDERAFATLYARLQGRIYRFAVQMSGRAGTAEDVTQEVFMNLARDPAGYDEARGSVLSYLYGMARNLVLRAVERDGAYVGIEQQVSDVLQCGDATPLDALMYEERIESVRRAVLSLPPVYREAVVLCELHEMNYADAAAVLGCPVGTVRSRLNRGRALLSERLRTAKGCCV